MGLRTVELHQKQWDTILCPPTACTHTLLPSTATVRITAKLSVENDNHLVREAANYQKFDESLFQHWSGLHLAPPLRDPTPVGAVVPQFYGFYQPAVGEDETGDGDAEKREKKRYRSNILLLEDCGQPINVDELDIDDRQECAALLFRLHFNHWTHNSFYPRNILVRQGDISETASSGPAIRHRYTCKRRFRLIDFGRAIQYDKEGNAVFQDADQEIREVRGRLRLERIPNGTWVNVPHTNTGNEIEKLATGRRREERQARLGLKIWEFIPGPRVVSEEEADFFI
ncbi:uncharacterized protein STEHIDRAFT_100239 [Stereum hirsutum FP-91666 SS1]|uniref:uncharacterized protein n=1 Tax=Stereum hirsutum (strain FP-91666) TaxID=721885 RepID=UPI000444A2EE|nr:uncharacterized protein STEHIDRAFT_100239 [Stereum hirsutum FP-91666 SS1]EIM84222.1 hypothetical protein STEHIDRAFT_100239 [Stereum hirsutum FP-91666 SS1]